jgi:hypothetical protein
MSCASRAKRAVLDGVGPATILLEPDRAPIPLIKVARALGWAPARDAESPVELAARREWRAARE